MAKVNAKDCATIEGVYSANAFADDAARNEKVPSDVLHGLRIGTAPDENGWFELEPAARHVGEPETPTFLAPTRGVDYAQFLNDVVSAAEKFGYQPQQSPGQGDPRISGLRQ